MVLQKISKSCFSFTLPSTLRFHSLGTGQGTQGFPKALRITFGFPKSILVHGNSALCTRWIDILLMFSSEVKTTKIEDQKEDLGKHLWISDQNISQPKQQKNNWPYLIYNLMVQFWIQKTFYHPSPIPRGFFWVGNSRNFHLFHWPNCHSTTLVQTFCSLSKPHARSNFSLWSFMMYLPPKTDRRNGNIDSE